MGSTINIVGTDKLYDLTKLREMLDGNENAVNTMVKKFINSTTQFLAELNKYARTRDNLMVRKLLYNLNFSKYQICTPCILTPHFALPLYPVSF